MILHKVAISNKEGPSGPDSKIIGAKEGIRMEMAIAMYREDKAIPRSLC